MGPVPSTIAASGGADRGRVLDKRTVVQVQDAIEALLPKTHTLEAAEKTASIYPRPPSCREMSFINDTIDGSNPRVAELGRRYAVPAPGIFKAIVVWVRVYSYVTPVNLDERKAEAARCPHYTVPNQTSDNGHLDVTVPYPTYQRDQTFIGLIKSVQLVVLSLPPPRYATTRTNSAGPPSTQH